MDLKSKHHENQKCKNKKDYQCNNKEEYLVKSIKTRLCNDWKNPTRLQWGYYYGFHSTRMIYDRVGKRTPQLEYLNVMKRYIVK